MTEEDDFYRLLEERVAERENLEKSMEIGEVIVDNPAFKQEIIDKFDPGEFDHFQYFIEFFDKLISSEKNIDDLITTMNISHLFDLFEELDKTKNTNYLSEETLNFFAQNIEDIRSMYISLFEKKRIDINRIRNNIDRLKEFKGANIGYV